jgi:hypothetical protein
MAGKMKGTEWRLHPVLFVVRIVLDTEESPLAVVFLKFYLGDEEFFT